MRHFIVCILVKRGGLSWPGLLVMAPFSTRWQCLVYWGGSVWLLWECAGTGEVKMVSPGFPVSGIRTLCPRGEAIKHSSFDSSFPPLPASTLSAFKRQPARQHLSPQFLSQTGLCFQTPHVWGLCSLDLLPPSGGGSPWGMALPGLPLGTFLGSRCCRGSEIMAGCRLASEKVRVITWWQQFRDYG